MHVSLRARDSKLFTLQAEDAHFCSYAYKPTPSPEQGVFTLLRLRDNTHGE